MCTVSYIPQDSESFILTSNRDEKAHRPTIPPRIYDLNGIMAGFPKDAVAGGSWIAANAAGRLSCLLNGAFIPHQKESYHTHSRGKILTDLVSSPLDVMFFFSQQDLTKTEPFTIITLEMKEEKVLRLTEFIWDGSKKYLKELDKDQAHVWSSVTLYSEEHRELRKEWFNSFISSNNSKVSTDLVWSFHTGNHSIDHSVNLVMQGQEGLKTVSITQVTQQYGTFAMKYFDLLENEEYYLNI